jgi:hypothetical protein
MSSAVLIFPFQAHSMPLYSIPARRACQSDHAYVTQTSTIIERPTLQSRPETLRRLIDAELPMAATEVHRIAVSAAAHTPFMIMSQGLCAPPCCSRFLSILHGTQVCTFLANVDIQLSLLQEAIFRVLANSSSLRSQMLYFCTGYIKWLKIGFGCLWTGD